jgi:L-arabinose isomerase
MKTYTSHKFWFIVGSQLMYGPEVLEQVRAHAKIMTDFFNQSDAVPAPVIQPGIATSPEDIVALFRKANADPECAGIITWMHTFSLPKCGSGARGKYKAPLAPPYSVQP